MQRHTHRQGLVRRAEDRPTATVSGVRKPAGAGRLPGRTMEAAWVHTAHHRLALRSSEALLASSSSSLDPTHTQGCPAQLDPPSSAMALGPRCACVVPHLTLGAHPIRPRTSTQLSTDETAPCCALPCPAVPSPVMFCFCSWQGQAPADLHPLHGHGCICHCDQCRAGDCHRHQGGRQAVLQARQRPPRLLEERDLQPAAEGE